MNSKNPNDPQDWQAEALERARRAAQAGDPNATLESLHQSYALDGLVRRIRAKWPPLDMDDVENAVSEAVDALFTALREGRRVLEPVAFLMKVADRRAYDRYQQVKRECRVDSEGFDRLPTAVADPFESVDGALSASLGRDIAAVEKMCVCSASPFNHYGRPLDRSPP